MAPRNFRIDHQVPAKPHILPAVPQVRLNILRGKARNLVRTVKPPIFLIGAAEDNDLVLASPDFPEAYAYMTVAERRVMIHYLGEGPELWVNGSCGEGFLLQDGDEIGFGPFSFVIEVDEGQPRRRDDRTDEQRKFAREMSAAMDEPEPVDIVRALMADVRRECQIPVPVPRIYTEAGPVPPTGTEPSGDRFVA
ncbi:MAG: FHA domain-containing protein [Planctomycetaceae bacterium]